MSIPEMKKKYQEKLLVLNIIPFELGTTNCQNPEQDNCHWHSMCFERSIRFNVSLMDILSKSGSPRVMRKYDESSLMQISQEFGTL